MFDSREWKIPASPLQDRQYTEDGKQAKFTDLPQRNARATEKAQW